MPVLQRGVTSNTTAILIAVILFVIIMFIYPFDPVTDEVDIHTRTMLAHDTCAKRGYREVRMLQDGGLVCYQLDPDMLHIPMDNLAP